MSCLGSGNHENTENHMEIWGAATEGTQQRKATALTPHMKESGGDKGPRPGRE